MLLLEKVYHNPQLARHAAHWYNRVSEVSPEVIALEHSILKYKFIVGEHCLDQDYIYYTLRKKVWTNRTTGPLDFRKFKSAMLEVPSELSSMLTHLQKQNFTLCDNIHGKLCPNHIIKNAQGLFFISPGLCHGARCVELDEACMLLTFKNPPFLIRECHHILAEVLQAHAQSSKSLHQTCFSCQYRSETPTTAKGQSGSVSNDADRPLPLSSLL